MQEVVAAYKDKGANGVKQVQASGLHIAGERFVVLKADDRSIYGKKVSFSDSAVLTALGRDWAADGEVWFLEWWLSRLDLRLTGACASPD